MEQDGDTNYRFNGCSKRKAAANASLNISKRHASNLKRVTSLLRKKKCTSRPLTKEEDEFLVTNGELVKQFYKRREKRAQLLTRQRELEDSPKELNEKCFQLAQAIHDAEFLVVYTGAGISTAASIPDYRGPNGIWTRLRKGKDIGHHDLTAAEPTYTHMALSYLHSKGIVRHIVSQNCDGLHLRSGLPKTSLSEVHGNMYIEVCKHCVPAREYVRTFDVTEKTSTFNHTTGRRCYRCGEPLVDTIVHFGERGKLRWPLNWQGACQAAKACDTILCLGSSLKVLRKYPWLWQMNRPPKKRPHLYIVNLQWTPKDKDASIKLNGKCDDVMRLVMKYLGFDVPPYVRADDPIFQISTALHSHEVLTAHRPLLKLPESHSIPCQNVVSSSKRKISVQDKYSFTTTTISTTHSSSNNTLSTSCGTSPSVSSTISTSSSSTRCRTGSNVDENVKLYGEKGCDFSLCHKDSLDYKDIKIKKEDDDKDVIKNDQDLFEELKYESDEKDGKLCNESLIPKYDNDVFPKIELKKEENDRENDRLMRLLETIKKEDVEGEIIDDNSLDMLKTVLENNEIFQESLEKNPFFRESLENNPILKETFEKYKIFKEVLENNEIFKESLQKTKTLTGPSEMDKSLNETTDKNEEIVGERNRVYRSSVSLNDLETTTATENIPKQESGLSRTLSLPLLTTHQNKEIDFYGTGLCIRSTGPALDQNSLEEDDFDETSLSSLTSDSKSEPTTADFKKETATSVNETGDSNSDFLFISDDSSDGGIVISVTNDGNFYDEERVPEDVVAAEDGGDPVLSFPAFNSYSDSETFLTNDDENGIARVLTHEGRKVRSCDLPVNLLEMSFDAGALGECPPYPRGLEGSLEENGGSGGSLFASEFVFSPQAELEGPFKALFSDTKCLSFKRDGRYLLQTKIINGVIHAASVKSLNDLNGDEMFTNNKEMFTNNKEMLCKNQNMFRNNNGMSTAIHQRTTPSPDVDYSPDREQGKNTTPQLVLDDDLKRLWFWGFDTPLKEETVATATIVKEPLQQQQRRVTRSSYQKALHSNPLPPPVEDPQMKKGGCQCLVANPGLCRLSAPRQETPGLPPEEEMLKAREAMRKRRQYNYRRFEPVFEVALKSLIYERKKLRRSRREEDTDGEEEEEEEEKGETEEEERSAMEEGKKFEEEVKVVPGWYGKGYRRMVKKKKTATSLSEEGKKG